MEDIVYIIGLIFVLAIILISIDDLLWDTYYSFNRLIGRIKKADIDVNEIEATPPKMLAIVVAAYNEENVLHSVISNLIQSNQYPRSMYHVFLGVYPNDDGTLRVASELEEQFPNVHKVIHVLNGPSSKADNINNVIKNIYKFERDHHMEFQAIVVHDSEDLVHPYEFKLENYLLEKHAVIQIPVFPLQEMPKLSNIFKNMISGTYADEFAENHYRLLLARNLTGAFVPSAGTGFVIRRDVLEHFPDGEVFPVGSLTEDYKLSLQFKQMGYHVYYVLEDVIRLRSDGKTSREFISTRSMFPNTYKAAVRQKTRWIYGITRQSFRLRDILKNHSLSFVAKYSLYRDWKAKFGNFLLGPGYLIFIYFIVSLFIDLPIMYPMFSFSWYLMLFLSIMMLQRQLLRFLAVKNVYGYKSALISSLFPPLLPFRMVLGNIINFHATAKAWMQGRDKKHKKRKQKQPKWSKTDHEFLEENVLRRFRRNLGDTLLYYEQIKLNQLQEALDEAEKTGERLGTTLRKQGIVSESDIARAVCDVTQQTFANFSQVQYENEYIKKYDKDRLFLLKAVPILRANNILVVITTVDADQDAIEQYFNEKVYFVFTTEETINSWLESTEESKEMNEALNKIERYVNNGYIKVDQGMIALTYQQANQDIDEVLYSMGLLRNHEIFSNEFIDANHRTEYELNV